MDNGKDLENNMEAREELAKKIVTRIKELKEQNPDEPIRLTGHSHGGNVQKIVTQMLVKQGYKSIVDDVMFLGTPHRDDIKLIYEAMKKEGKIVNAYDYSDMAQRWGGRGSLTVRMEILKEGEKEGETIKTTKVIQEIGPARQKINNPRVVNIEVESPAIEPFFGDHVEMDSKEVIEQISEGPTHNKFEDIYNISP